jgi:hypothetical protein
LWLRLPTALLPQYGEGSAQAHLTTALFGLGLRAAADRGARDCRTTSMCRMTCRASRCRLSRRCLLAAETDLAAPMQRARELTLDGFGVRVGYSRSMAFIPLTHWCRDVCHYCTFAAPPRRGERAFLTVERGAGDRAARARPPAATRRSSRSATSPSCAIAQARRELAALGFASTLEYLAHCARRGVRGDRDCCRTSTRA